MAMSRPTCELSAANPMAPPATTPNRPPKTASRTMIAVGEDPYEPLTSSLKGVSAGGSARRRESPSRRGETCSEAC